MFRTHLTQTKPDRRPQNESSADMGLTMIQTQVKCPTWLWIIHEVMSHLADKKTLKSKVSGALRKAKPVIVTDVGGLLYRAGCR